MLIAWQTRGPKGKRRKARGLVSADSMERRAEPVSFPHEVFEEEILRHLGEVDPADVFGNGPTSEVAQLVTQLAGVKARRAENKRAALEGKGSQTFLAEVAVELEATEAELTRKLAEDRRKQSNPPAAALAEAQALLGRPVGEGRLLVGAAKSEAARDRFRRLLRNAIEKVWVVTVASGVYRTARVRVQFREGGHRDYSIFIRSAGNGRERLVHSSSTTNRRYFCIGGDPWTGEGGRVVGPFLFDDDPPPPDLSQPAGAEEARQRMLNYSPEFLRGLLSGGH